MSSFINFYIESLFIGVLGRDDYLGHYAPFYIESYSGRIFVPLDIINNYPKEFFNYFDFYMCI